MTSPRVEVHSARTELATAVAGELLARLADAQGAGHQPQIALTGGTIANSVHHEVARLSPTSGVDWNRVVVWWADERFVESMSPERNAVGARAAFLDVVGATQVHEIPSTEHADDAEAAAAAYGALLREHGSGEFDVVMLGVGPDGHVASLFPGYPGLAVDDAIAIGLTDAPKPPPARVSLTFPALNRSRAVWFLVSGAEKARAVAAGLAADGSVEHTPARGVSGSRETIWFLDADAAADL